MQFKSRVRLLIEIQLQEKVKTCKTEFSIRSFEIHIEPFPTIEERDP